LGINNISNLLNYLIMKKLVFIAVLILLSGFTFGQSLQKGTLIGTHVISVTLQPGVTMEKYAEFVKTKLIPEIEKNMPNFKVYLLKGIRGENNNSLGLLYVIKSAQDRDKYYNADGSDNELMKSVNAKLKPVTDEIGKLGTLDTKYTDWIIQ
jgi:hypothetical protein